MTWPKRPAISGFMACRCSFSRKERAVLSEKAFKEFARLSQGRMVPFRSQCGRDTCAASFSGGGVCHWRTAGSGIARPSRRPADDRASQERQDRMTVVFYILAGLLASSSSSLPPSSGRTRQGWRKPCASADRSCSRSSDACLSLPGGQALGGMMLSGALAWYSSNRVRRGTRKTPGKRSTVRTAALEMELDHDSGELEGLVLAGRYEARMLGTMSQQELLELLA